MKETLEEAAREYSSFRENKLEENSAFIDFINGAKWKAERSYSEKELRNAMNWMMTQYFEFHEWPAMGRVNHYIQTIKQQEQ
jgi:hypothetical protein